MEQRSFDTVDEAVRYIKSEYKSEYVDYEEVKQIIDILLDPFLKNESSLNKKFKHETKEDYRSLINHYSTNVAKLWRLTEKKLELNKMELSSQEIGNIFAVYLFGHSKIAPLMNDSSITDIHVLGHNKIFYEKGDVAYRYDEGKCFTPEEYKIFIQKRLELAGKTLNAGESKKADFELFGDRYNAKDISISPASPTLIIRKHAEVRDHRKIDDLIYGRQLTTAMANFLITCIKGEANGIIAGITGSGKTTEFRALFNQALHSLTKKAFVVEDTPELFLNYDFMEVLVTTKGDNPYTISDGIQDALRSKPRYILIGEIRGTEIVDAVEAGATGHSTWFSFHADTPQQVLNRAKLKYIQKLRVGSEEAMEMLCDTIDIIVTLTNIPGVGRRTEIFHCSYDPDIKRTKFKTIFEYDIEKDTYYFRNGIPYDMARLLRFRGATKDEVLQYCYPDHERQEAKAKIENEYVKETYKNTNTQVEPIEDRKCKTDNSTKYIDNIQNQCEKDVEWAVLSKSDNGQDNEEAPLINNTVVTARHKTKKSKQNPFE